MTTTMTEGRNVSVTLTTDEARRIEDGLTTAMCLSDNWRNRDLLNRLRAQLGETLATRFGSE